MRKIIAAFEAPDFSESVMRFINAMNKASRVTVTAVFLPAPVYTRLWSHADTPGSGMLLPITADIKPVFISHR